MVLKEFYRILRPNGVLVVCIIVRNSLWGQLYVKKAKQGHRFYRYARFYSLSELEEVIEKHDLRILDYKYTLDLFTLICCRRRKSKKQSTSRKFCACKSH